MDPTETVKLIGEAIGAAKAVGNLVNIVADVLPLKGRNELKAAVTGLEKNLHDLQQVNFELYKESTALAIANRTAEKTISQLEKELSQLQATVDLSKLYEVVDALDNTVVAKRLAGVGRKEPPHYMCASCFREGKNKFLNPVGFFTGITDMECPACKTKVRLPNDKSQHALTAPKTSFNVWDV